MIPVYRKNDSFLQQVHPGAQLALALSLMALSLLSDNPACQIAVILATACLALSAGVLRQWFSWWKLCLVIFIAAMVINPLVSRYGATVIWRGPTVPVLGHLFITAEAVAYGAGMGLRLSAVIWVFALITLSVDPDNVLGLLKGRGASSALVSALTMRMVPAVMSDAGDLLDAQRSRGIVVDEGSRWKVLKSRLPLVKMILSTSLDRGINLAEAMESRAYGSGRRTRYARQTFGAGDLMVLACAVAILALSIAGLAAGLLSFTYYPTLSVHYNPASLAVTLAPVAVAFAVLLLSRMWKRSNWLRLRT
ncbi:MAG: energy-coupling factor transporter transmembrane component T family protein [Candidatus Geothermincolia bacterium]